MAGETDAHHLPDVLDALSVEISTFHSKREELLGSNVGKWALVKGEAVVFPIDTQSDAINTGYREFGNVPFLVGQVLPADRGATFVTPNLNL